MNIRTDVAHEDVETIIINNNPGTQDLVFISLYWSFCGCWYVAYVVGLICLRG